LGNRRNVNKMMQQVQQMQQQMQQAQEELAQETVTASAGGGAVKATMTGGMELVANKKLGGITGGLGDLGLNLPGL
jgi:DNA-binding protein YbaB